jgi:CelD/BcsL family acetyltransferase involved in cellulose biosynthesis
VGPWPPPKGPLTCPADASGVAVREVARKLAARDDWDIVEVEAVPAEQRWGQELRTVTVTRHPNHVLHLAPRTWDELFTASSRNFRSQHGNRRRRLERRYQVTYRRTVDRSTLESDVDTFLALHWQRWGEEVNVLTPARVPFIQDFAEQALERGWLALWFLEVNGQAVAAQLDFRFAGTEVLFMAGSDPAFADDHVGFLIAFHAVREAAEAGVREFHFLRGDEQHKRRLPSTNQPVDHLLFSRTLLGDATIGLSALTRRARSAASSRLRGRSGRAGDS